jgi:hypothetical protein
MIGSCCGSHAALSGSALGSSKLLLAPQPLASQDLAKQTIHLVTMKRKRVMKIHLLAKSRHVSYSNRHSTPHTLSITRVIGSGSVAVKSKTVAVAKSCQ